MSSSVLTSRGQWKSECLRGMMMMMMMMRGLKRTSHSSRSKLWRNSVISKQFPRKEVVVVVRTYSNFQLTLAFHWLLSFNELFASDESSWRYKDETRRSRRMISHQDKSQQQSREHKINCFFNWNPKNFSCGRKRLISMYHKLEFTTWRTKFCCERN